jgi:hypothetical protein
MNTQQYTNNLLKIMNKISEMSEKLVKKLSLGIDCCGELNKIALVRSYYNTLLRNIPETSISGCGDCTPIILDMEGRQASFTLVEDYFYSPTSDDYFIIGNTTYQLYEEPNSHWLKILAAIINAEGTYSATYTENGEFIEFGGEIITGEPTGYWENFSCILTIEGKNYASDNNAPITYYWISPEEHIWNIGVLYGGIDPVTGNGLSLKDANCTTIGTAYRQIWYAQWSWTMPLSDSYFREIYLSNGDQSFELSLFEDEVAVDVYGSMQTWLGLVQEVVDHINNNTDTTQFRAALDGLTVTLFYEGEEDLLGVFVFTEKRAGSSASFQSPYVEENVEVPGISTNCIESTVSKCLSNKEIQIIYSHVSDLTGLCFNNNCN